MNNCKKIYSHHFIVLEYSKVDFLINPSQIAASFIPQHRLGNQNGKQDDTENTLQQDFYQGQKIIVWDIDAHLRKKFQLLDLSRVDFALVLQKNKPMVAVGVPQGKLTNIHFDELWGVPRILANQLKAKGILGLRFSAKSKIQYFIDIENFATRLAKEREKE